MERRYDLSLTGLSKADLDATLRPLLVRELARDVRFRLREVIRLREEQQLPVGTRKFHRKARRSRNRRHRGNPRRKRFLQNLKRSPAAH